jgi:membrane protein DedA with SNARE-associated domain
MNCLKIFAHFILQHIFTLTDIPIGTMIGASAFSAGANDETSPELTLFLYISGAAVGAMIGYQLGSLYDDRRHRQASEIEEQRSLTTSFSNN